MSKNDQIELTPGLGPYVRVAALVEFAAFDQTQMPTLYHLFDLINVPAVLAEGRMPPFTAQRTLYLSFISGLNRGRSHIDLTLITPSQQTQHIGGAYVVFGGDELEVRLTYSMQVEFKEEGLHWICVYCDTRFMTSIPVKIVCVPIEVVK